MSLLPASIRLKLARGFVRMLGVQHQPWDDFWYQELGVRSITGANVTADSAMRTSAVYACVRLISEAGGSLPASAMRLAGKVRSVAQDSPIHRLLHKAPNEAMTPIVYKTVMFAHLSLRGNAFSYVWRDGYEVPQAIIPLHPQNVKVEISKSDGFPDYSVRNRDKDFMPVARRNMLHYRLLTDDGFTGLGPLQLARDQIGVARMADEWYGQFLKNDATPRGFLFLPQKLAGRNPDEISKTREKIRDDYMLTVTGENRGKIPVMDGGMEFKAVGISPVDMQLLESRKYSVADIARIFRVPLHMIGETEKTTSWGSGIEQMSIGFVVYTLMPWLVAFEQEIERVLFAGLDDLYCKFNVRALLRGDLKTEMEAYEIALRMGMRNVDEVRALNDENPVQGGDVYLRELNRVPLDASYQPQASRVTVGPERQQSAADGEFVTLDDVKSLIRSNGNGHRG